MVGLDSGCRALQDAAGFFGSTVKGFLGADIAAEGSLDVRREAPMTWRATGGDGSPGGLADFRASAMARESASVPRAAASVRVGRLPAAVLRAFWDSAELR